MISQHTDPPGHCNEFATKKTNKKKERKKNSSRFLLMVRFYDLNSLVLLLLRLLLFWLSLVTRLVWGVGNVYLLCYPNPPPLPPLHDSDVKTEERARAPGPSGWAPLPLAV